MMKRSITLIIALLMCLTAFAQKVNIIGIVTDSADGSPVIGATVTSKDKNGKVVSGTTADVRGQYLLSINPKVEVSLEFSYLGMTTVNSQIAGRTQIDISLEQVATSVETVVVTALGLQRETKALNYSRQSVTAEALSENRTPDFVSSLQGRVAGLQVASPGQNTGSSGVVIRGYSSATSDNNAIFVVDGVIMENGAIGGESDGLDYGNAMGDINPDDIASIEVLKGPNATALYGSRAANGVIMITTKRSEGNNKIKITYGNNTTFQQISEYPSYQNTFGVGMDLSIQTSNIMYSPNPITGGRYRSWGPMMLGQTYVAIDGVERQYLPQADNIKNFYQTSCLMSNTVTIEGGSKDNSVRLSYTDYRGNSIVEGVNNEAKRTFNLNLFNKFNNWIQLSSRITYVVDDVQNRQYINANNRNPVNTYVHMARSTSLEELRQYKDEFGHETSTNRNTSNPYWIINENPTRDVRDRLTGAFNLTMNLPYGLKLLGRAGLDFYWWSGTTFQNLGGMNDPAGKISEFTDIFKGTTFEGSAVWDRRFGDLSINAMAGASTNSRSDDRRTQNVIGLVESSFIHISNSLEKITPEQNLYNRKTNSVYASVSFGWKDMLYLDGTFRNDWSSTLPIDNCSFAYPSIGTSFIFSQLFNNELKKSISFGKLRLSYAMVGNDTTPYRTSQYYTIGGQFNGTPFTDYNSTRNNANLKPEITVSYEAGLEMKFMKDRLGFDLTYYDSSTYNQIVAAYVTPTSGYERRYFNAGEIRNYGVELSINATPVKTRNFTWNTVVNFAKNNSLVVSLLEEYDVSSITLYSASNCSVNAEVGKPYGYIRGIGVVKNEQGQMIMNDGGDYFETDANAGFGTVSPDWTMGYLNEFRYKGLSFSFLIDIKRGGVMYSNTYKKMMTNGMTTENYDGRVGYFLAKTIYNEGNEELTHGISWGNNVVQREYDVDGKTIGYKKVEKYYTPSGYEYCRSNINEFAIFDSSYIKVREISVGYSLPASMLRKTPLSNVRISFVTRNPFTLYKNTPDGIDPESAATVGNGRGIENGSLPPITTFGFDIKISTK